MVLTFPASYVFRTRVRVLTSAQDDSGFYFAGLGEFIVREVADAGTGVVVTFTAPGDDPGEGTATTYDLRVSDTALTEETWAAATPISAPTPIAAGLPQKFLSKELAANEPRYIGLKSRRSRECLRDIKRRP